MVKFNSSKEETEIISEIVDRASRLFKIKDRTSLMMDIEATHCNGNRLKLNELLATNDFNFAHDIRGIQDHLNRRTGKLMDCFLPRFSE